MASKKKESKKERLFSIFLNIVLSVAILFVIFAIQFTITTNQNYNSHYILANTDPNGISMMHNGSFDKWWNSKTAICNNTNCTQKDFYSEYSITGYNFKDFKFKDGSKAAKDVAA